MKELDNKLAGALYDCETCNRLFKPTFIETFINEYSTWDSVKAIKGSFLDNYFVPVKNENYYGVAFLETPQDWNTNYYIVKTYSTASLFKKGYKQRYINVCSKTEDKETMKELDKEMIKELRYFESINKDIMLCYAEKFIEDYSTWEAVKAVEGCLLDDYFVTLGNDEIYGVGFIETPKNTQVSYYNIKIYNSAIELENAYQEKYIQYLECVVDTVDGERSAINYLVGLLNEGFKVSSLENELYNAPYLNNENDNDSLYLRLVEMTEGNFKGLVIKALDEYIYILRDKAEKDKKAIVNDQYDFEMSDFLASFNKNYEMLYDGKITRKKALKALDYFDDSMTDRQKKLLNNFSIYRQDFIASDRDEGWN